VDVVASQVKVAPSLTDTIKSRQLGVLGCSGLTKRIPTIDDVATLAGVGRTTVSRVLNNGPNVRPEVRNRVQLAVSKLGYKVNVQARNLAGGTSRQIALVHASDLDTEPNSYYHSGLELGALRGCAELGYQLVTHTVNQNDPSALQRIVELIDQKRCDGIILTPPFSDNVSLVKQIKAKGCPVVSVSGGDPVRLLTSTVGIDDVRAGDEMAQYLIGLGHRRFGFIKGLSGHVSAEGRFDGFERALKAAGIDVATAAVERGNFTFRSGIECAQHILDRPHPPTALVCANDDMAAGALLTIHKMGLKIPEEISVTGFDDTPVSEIVWPPLTTVHQPIKTIGRSAVELVVAAISGAAGVPEHRHENIAFRLVVRDSTAPA
jgi:LacI family transcriptional regulator